MLKHTRAPYLPITPDHADAYSNPTTKSTYTNTAADFHACASDSDARTSAHTDSYTADLSLRHHW